MLLFEEKNDHMFRYVQLINLFNTFNFTFTFTSTFTKNTFTVAIGTPHI